MLKQIRMKYLFSFGTVILFLLSWDLKKVEAEYNKTIVIIRRGYCHELRKLHLICEIDPLQANHVATA